MNTTTSTKTKQDAAIVLKTMGWKPWLRFSLFVLSIPAILGVSAGTLDWPMAWFYVGLMIATTWVYLAIMLRISPDLLIERFQFLKGEGVKGWDKVIAPLVALYGPLSLWIVAGLDRRFGWTAEIPMTVQLIALGITALGYALMIWAVAVNRFFSAVVRIQRDRGHRVITAGPYRWVRHPGYTGGSIAILATSLALGSLWALIPAGLTTMLLIVRTILEDRTLQAELAGYQDYAQQTRYRLLPGLW